MFGLNPMLVPVYQATLTGTLPGQVVNVPIRNVGLLKRSKFSFAQGAAETQTLTPNGLANLFSNVTLTYTIRNETTLF